MKIFVQIAGLIEGDAVHGEREMEMKTGATVKDVISQGDKAFAFKKKYFKLLLKQGRMPSILLNGDRLDLPEGYSYKLSDGEKLSILLPFSGG